MAKQGEYHILNLGAGVQSTTLYLMFMRGVLTPRLDCAIFADTQDEPEAVYRHLEWLKSLQKDGGAPILVGTAGRIGDGLKMGRNSTGQRFAAIPAFTTQDSGATVGRTRRQCSKEYKLEVIGRVLRRDFLDLPPGRAPRGVVVHQYIGISFDEAGRAARIARQPRPKYIRLHFPLVERWITRAQCETWLREHGNVPHEVPRSACVFCPFHSDAEWLRIKENPQDWQRAVEIDEVLRTSGAVANRDMRQTMYLHRTCQPLVQIEFKPTGDPRQQQSNLNFAAECLGVCGV